MAEAWYYDPWNQCFRDQDAAGAMGHDRYCYDVIRDPYTIEMQYIEFRAQKFCAPELGPVQTGKGCSNAADIMLTPPGEVSGITDAEGCRTMCDGYGAACNAAQFTTGWIAWGDSQTSGGYTTVYQSAGVQTLLGSTCKLATCSDCSSGTCNSAGTFGCLSTETCTSIGLAGAGCKGELDT